MSKFLVFLVCLFLNHSLWSVTEDPTIIYSESVGDRFEIYVDLPADYTENQEYSFVFYMDANLKMGKELRRQIALPENKARLKHTIFIGVGHVGGYRMRRRRDFIPPKFINKQYTPGKDQNFGQAHRFYEFLGTELMPYINKQYKGNGRNSLIGHSFSGLFAYYCLFKEDRLFNNHIALSPSLWANYNNFFEAEESFHLSNSNLNAYLYHACGSQEWTNKVLSTSRRMKNTLTQHNYSGLVYEYHEHSGKGHNDMVPQSLEYILTHLKF